MKKLIICLFIFITLFEAASFAEDAAVTLCPFPVTVNGQEVNLKSSEYPFITYHDITYMPLTYDLCRFAGLKTRWYEKANGNVLYVGFSGDFLNELKEYPSPRTGKTEPAVIADGYGIALQDPAPVIDNGKEEYPFLNFRGVTYMPLTWRFAHDLFGWDYGFGIDGLWIEARNAVRPEIADNVIDNMINGSKMNYIRTDYVYTFDSYAGYPSTTFGGQYEFVYRTRGEEEKRFSLENELKSLHVTYFDSEILSNGITMVDAEVPPTLEGSALTIRCTGAGKCRYIVLKIDMEKEKIVSTEKVI